MTLLETVVSMAVIAVVLMPLTNLYLQTKHLSKASLSETQAAYWAQYILEQQKAKEFDSIASTSWQKQVGYYYKIEVVIVNHNLVECDVTDEEYLKKITVTIQYPENKRDKELSVTILRANRVFNEYAS